MNNFEHWKLWCSKLPTTDLYIRATWIYLISSALQRRVWTGNEVQPVYPNQFMLFVAKPGVGKSMPVSAARAILEHHKRREEDIEEGTEAKLLFPISADSTSYQAFMRAIAENTSKYRTADERWHMHQSTSFFLDEATSIFNTDAQPMIDLLNKGWSCSSHHKHDAISTKYRPLKNICINLIGCTQPDKFARLSATDVLGSGFSRRALFIYAAKNRFSMTLIPPPTPEMMESRDVILAHILKLAHVNGFVSFTPDAWAVLDAWWMDPLRESKILNKSPKMVNYYVSKNLHVCKVAMAIQFGKASDSMEITLESLNEAFEFLAEIEKDMHLCYTGNSDKHAEVKEMVVAHLRNTGAPMSFKALYTPHGGTMNIIEFRQALEDLTAMGSIKLNADGKYSHD